MKIAISVGHNPTAPGAAFENYTEYSEVILIASFLVQNLQREGHLAYIIGTGGLKHKVSQINDIEPDIAVEIHLNAANTYAHGCETLYCPGSKIGKQLAQNVQTELNKVTNNRDRGVKEGWYHMIKPPNPKAQKDYFLAETCCPAIIIEPFFIDNIERNRFIDNLEIQNEMAKSIMKGILK